MALTDQQRADVRLYTGWSARFGQFDSDLEQAMNGLDTLPEHEAQVISLLASLKQVDADLLASRGRYKADKVGSIELNRAEPAQLRRDGRSFVLRICSLLGVKRRSDVFGGGAPASNCIAK